MKAKSFIVALVAASALVMLSAVVATEASATNVAAPSITISADPNPVLIGGTTDLSGIVVSADHAQDVYLDVYAGPGCAEDNYLVSYTGANPITWTGDTGVFGPITSPQLQSLDGFSFSATYDDESFGCVDVAVVTSLPAGQGDDTSATDDETAEAADNETAENETWACYSHFQDAPIAITISQFNYLTKAPQPELGGKPYWMNGFIPFANMTAANGQAIGNGYYLHCNLGGPPVLPNMWVNSDGTPLGSNHYADWVAEFGGGATDPAGKPAAFNFYPVVAN